LNVFTSVEGRAKLFTVPSV